MNRAAGDFRLGYGSPCIDTGTDLSALITTDLDGNPRPQDGNWDGIAAFDMGAYEYNPQTADSNTDGIPDWWCHHYLLDPTAAGMADANPDNDWQTTYQEWIADTDPTNELACFHIERIELGENGSPVTIHFISSSNRVYTLRSCAGLGQGSWTDVPGQTARPGSGGLDSLSDTNAAPQKFYRVRVDVP